METHTTVEIRDLSKKYQKCKDFAVENINIECHEGEIVGLVGKNGAGKSTIIKCLTGLLPFEKGVIKINGIDIKEQPVKAKMHLGYVSDNRAMFEKMTGTEYINFIADIHKVSLEQRCLQIEKLQKVFDLGPRIDSIINSYSHGMKQKLCIMASLVHQPKLWLLDEPLTGLDPQTGNALRNYMLEYKEAGNTVLYSSHNIDAIEKTCGRAYIVDKGQIVKCVEIDAFRKENPDKSLEAAFIELFEE